MHGTDCPHTDGPGVTSTRLPHRVKGGFWETERETPGKPAPGRPAPGGTQAAGTRAGTGAHGLHLRLGLVNILLRSVPQHGFLRAGFLQAEHGLTATNPRPRGVWAVTW